jgi:hypothetical protein
VPKLLGDQQCTLNQADPENKRWNQNVRKPRATAMAPLSRQSHHAIISLHTLEVAKALKRSGESATDFSDAILSSHFWRDRLDAKKLVQNRFVNVSSSRE